MNIFGNFHVPRFPKYSAFVWKNGNFWRYFEEKEQIIQIFSVISIILDFLNMVHLYGKMKTTGGILGKVANDMNIFGNFHLPRFSKYSAFVWKNGNYWRYFRKSYK